MEEGRLNTEMGLKQRKHLEQTKIGVRIVQARRWCKGMIQQRLGFAALSKCQHGSDLLAHPERLFT